MPFTGSQNTEPERVPELRSTENSRVLELAKKKDSSLPPSPGSTVEADAKASGRVDQIGAINAELPEAIEQIRDSGCT
ncbi:hypothetical protein LTR27_008557 [Elasticomyces elasticus]|nr:hypothetical protein LTR27_008557 [Elasticomyces elasticus]